VGDDPTSWHCCAAKTAPFLFYFIYFFLLFLHFSPSLSFFLSWCGEPISDVDKSLGLTANTISSDLAAAARQPAERC
jgi:hypothetical protein